MWSPRLCELYRAYHFKQDIKNLSPKITDCRYSRDSFFSSWRVITFNIKKLGCSDFPSCFSLTPVMAEASGELPAKTGAPPQVQSKADGAGWDALCGHVSFHYFLNSLYYIILLYFYSIFLLIFFLNQLMLFHFKWFVQSLEGIWRETAAVKWMPGMLYLIALCDCPSLCSPDLCPC